LLGAALPAIVKAGIVFIVALFASWAVAIAGSRLLSIAWIPLARRTPTDQCLLAK
jgi:hypothetical protein